MDAKKSGDASVPQNLAESIKKRIKSEMRSASLRGSDTRDDEVRSEIVDEMFRDFLAEKMEMVEQEYIRKRKKEDSNEVKIKKRRESNELDQKKHVQKSKDLSQKSKSIQDTITLASIQKETKNEHATTSINNVSSDAFSEKKKDCESMVHLHKMTPALKGLSDISSEDTGAKETVKESSGKSLTIPKIKSKIELKISSASANLISSGELVPLPGKKNPKPLEEGEVLSSNSAESSEDSDSEDDKSEGKKDENEISETGSLSDSETEKSSSKSKKKKKKKHKHKTGKHKKKKKKTKKKKSKKSSRSRSRSPRERHRSSSREEYRERSPVHVERKWVAEKGKPMVLFTKSYRMRHSTSERSRSRERDRSYDRSHDDRRERNRSYDRSRSRERDRSYDRSRDRRSDDRSHDDRRDRKEEDQSHDDRCERRKDTSSEQENDDKHLQIDKAKLRQIAIANALKTGGRVNVSHDTMVKLRSGGKSVEELTDYCKKISDKDKQRQLEKDQRPDDSLSDTSEEPEQKSEDEDFTIHHPFSVKEAPPIVLNIRNSKQLPTLTPQAKVTESAKLRLTFPVSSGSQHRAKESEWVPVEKTTAQVTATTTTTTVAIAGSTSVPTQQKTISIPTPAPVPPTITTAAEAAVQVAAVKVPEKDKVFKDPPAIPIDIGRIVSERLAAVRRLERNPNDVQAISQMRTAQQKASRWAESKVLPGQFMGSTGATILSQQELIGPDKKRQAWARKEQLTTAAPLSGGVGMMLLQKLGWKKGEGLGKNKDGPQTPLLLDVKIDRKGLISQEEGQKKVPAPRAPRTAIRDLSGKHPVSALVELCSKRRWPSPQFELVEESGPAHKKNFIFKVAVNGTYYQSAAGCNNKKQAKALSATACLQELGLVPR